MEIMAGGAIDQYANMDYHDENTKGGRAGKRYVVISKFYSVDNLESFGFLRPKAV